MLTAPDVVPAVNVLVTMPVEFVVALVVESEPHDVEFKLRLTVAFCTGPPVALFTNIVIVDGWVTTTHSPLLVIVEVSSGMYAALPIPPRMSSPAIVMKIRYDRIFPHLSMHINRTDI